LLIVSLDLVVLFPHGAHSDRALMQEIFEDGYVVLEVTEFGVALDFLQS
jgi:hypothetical protein